jgi:hypothetical protein
MLLKLYLVDVGHNRPNHVKFSYLFYYFAIFPLIFIAFIFSFMVQYSHYYLLNTDVAICWTREVICNSIYLLL